MTFSFGKKQIEPAWKKIYKKRSPKRGTSEMLRTIDTIQKTGDYDRHDFMKRVLSANPKIAVQDCQRFIDGFGTSRDKVQKWMAKFNDWTDKEKVFLQQLTMAMQQEIIAWTIKQKEKQKEADAVKK